MKITLDVKQFMADAAGMTAQEYRGYTRILMMEGARGGSFTFTEALEATGIQSPTAFNNIMERFEKDVHGNYSSKHPKPRKRTPKNPAELGEFVLPEGLCEAPSQAEALMAKLAEFEAMRKRIKKPIRSRLSVNATLAKFDSYGDLMDALEASIGNEWQGLFPPKSKASTMNGGQRFDNSQWDGSF